jgi:hypothetical protein
MIRIGVRRVFKAGRQAYKIESIHALGIDDLPDAYIRSDPNCYKTETGSLFITAGKLTAELKIGEVLTTMVFHKSLLPVIESCGNNLVRIRKAWAGTTTFEI